MADQIPVDENQWYTIEINHTLYTLPIRYQDVHYVGQGAFGAVMYVHRSTLVAFISSSEILL